MTDLATTSVISRTAENTSQKSNLPDAEAFRQGETEDESSEDTQHRSRPADEESRSQFKPEWSEAQAGLCCIAKKKKSSF